MASSLPDGTSQLNVDAAISAADNKMGIGAIVRDFDGQNMATISKPIVGNHSSMIMKGRALSLGLVGLVTIMLPLEAIETGQMVFKIQCHIVDFLAAVTTLLSFFFMRLRILMGITPLIKRHMVLLDFCSWVE